MSLHPAHSKLWLKSLEQKPEPKENTAKDVEEGEAPPPAKILKFFEKNPNPDDGVLHAWAEKQGYDPHEVEEQVYRLATTFTKFAAHGKAKEKGVKFADVDAKQLEMGIKVEHEHTTDPETAKRIALDHLAEIPDYYTRLDKMEKEAKK